MKTRVLNLSFSLLFCLGLTACNKEEFYEKEFLETPTSGTTNGSVNGGVGNTQGGVDSGVDGGTSGGSTTGSSTGGTDGSTVGGTTGGTDGSTIGGTDGSTIGGTTGSTDGSTVGGTIGGTTGGTDGSTVGGTTGGTDGSTVGGTTGGTDGSTIGGTTGGTDGSTVGGTTGGTDGSTVGGTTGGGTTGGGTTGGTDGSTVGGTSGGTTGSTVGGTTGGVAAQEIFHQAAEETKKLDIVWVIDNSGSMSDEQTALGVNFAAFIDEFIAKNVNFKMAITTTDTSSSSRKGRMVTDSDVKLTSAMAQANPNRFKNDFKNLVKVGINGSGSEQGLAASEGFMEKYTSSFVRPEAYLAVVLISDEEDQSSKSVAHYTNYLKGFKSTEGLVKVYSVVDVNNTNCCQSGIATGSARYKQASVNTAGLIADIRDDFHNVLSDMGDSIINLLDSFALASAPINGSLKVYVNGVESTAYTYDAATHSIKFNTGSLPPVGAEIKVTYLK